MTGMRTQSNLLVTAAQSLASKAKRDSNCLVFAVIFVASLFFIFKVIPGGVELPSNVGDGLFVPDSPRFLLYISGGAIALLSLVGFWSTLLSHKAASKTSQLSELVDLRELAALLILGLCLPLISWLGLPAAGAGVGLGLLLLSGTRKPFAYVTVGALMPIIVWGFFKYALNVPIPLTQF